MDHITKLVGLVGRKSAGKDTAALILADQGFEVVKFAGALKEMMRSYFRYIGVEKGAIEELIEGSCKEAPTFFLEKKSTRHAMQTLGTEWGRQLIGEDIWVNSCMMHCKQFEKAVITDVRFPNELAAVRASGGLTIRINRAATRVEDTHASEALIDSLDVDFEIDNNGTIEDLHQQILATTKALHVKQ